MNEKCLFIPQYMQCIDEHFRIVEDKRSLDGGREGGREIRP